MATGTPTSPAGTPASSSGFDPNAAASGSSGLGTTSNTAWGVPSGAASTPIPGVTDPTGKQMTYEQAAEQWYQMPAAQRNQILAEMKAAGYDTGISTTEPSLDQGYQMWVKLLRDSISGNVDPLTMLSQQQAATSSAPAAKVAPRYIGLGKYKIDLTNPADAQMAADQVAQSLLGRRATAQEQSAILAGLHNAETISGQAMNQQLVSANMAYYEAVNGGVTPTPGPYTPASSSGVGPNVAGPVSPTEGQSVAAAGGTSALTPGAAGTSVPAGAVQLADGAYILPPDQPITNPMAPSATAQAYSYFMNSNPNEVRGRTIAAAMQAISNFVGQK